METHAASELLRSLPSVEELLQTEPLRSAAVRRSGPLAAAAARRSVERQRVAILGGSPERPDPAALAAEAAADVARSAAPSLRPVINATGVVLHTNLGRAPLAGAAVEAVDQAARGYTNLELDLEDGTRGTRHRHIENLVRELTGSEAALAVNNNAAAVLLSLAAIARGRDVVISRGQLVEIGGSFRIPDILEQSGARLVEVGTTNRTRLRDYDRAIGADTAVLMRVHPSNFRTVGFTEEVSIEDLCALAQERDLLVLDDIGSGLLRDARTGVFRGEPAAARSLAAGADLVCFSADKLLGGPQAGVVAGRAAAVERLRGHPLARALRIDKLSLAALEATLRLHLEGSRTPATAMLLASPAELDERAAHLLDTLRTGLGARARCGLAEDAAPAGGGSLPLVELPGPVVTVRARDCDAGELAARLRNGEPPVVARVHDGALLLDPRTVTAQEAAALAAAVVTALERG